MRDSIKQRMVKHQYAQCDIFSPPGRRWESDAVYMVDMLFGVSDLRPF